ncbi:MAG: class I SAM-dependent methyltransferase [Geminicoccaceae bacterium]|nr:class I SAM-dependent methyltransferase [Geminicoccaceae bacterium]
MLVHSLVMSQYKRPRGLVGLIVAGSLARRATHVERNDWTVECLDLRPGMRILEIGCGPGLGVEACSRKLEGGSILGIDHSRLMVRKARSRNRAAIRDKRAEIRLCTLDDVAGSDGPFDHIYSINAIQYLGSLNRVFERIHALLADGGQVASTYQSRSRHPTRTDALDMAARIEAAMEAAGFHHMLHHELLSAEVPAICVVGQKDPSVPEVSGGI